MTRAALFAALAASLLWPVVGAAQAAESDVVFAQGTLHSGWACPWICFCTEDLEGAVAFDLAAGTATFAFADPAWDWPWLPAPSACGAALFAPGSCERTAGGDVECRDGSQCMRILSDGWFEFYPGWEGNACWDRETCYSFGCYPDGPLYFGRMARVT